MEVGWCRLALLGPGMMLPDVEEGAVGTFSGQVWAAGVTDRTRATDPHPLLVAELGYGPGGSLPLDNEDWTWQPAFPNPDYSAPDEQAGNDEYQSVLTAPSATGSPYVRLSTP